MHRIDAPATALIAVLTAIVSGAVIVAGQVDLAAIAAGFIPIRVEGAPSLPGMAPVWLTPLTATLVHGFWGHLLLNLLIFWVCGRAVEQPLGGAGIAALYVVGAYASAAGQWIAGPTDPMPMIGASGAMSAVIGAYSLMFSQRRVRAIGPVPATTVRILWLASAWIAVQLLTGVAFRGVLAIAIAAHIGGFLSGLLMARPLLRWRFRKA